MNRKYCGLLKGGRKIYCWANTQALAQMRLIRRACREVGNYTFTDLSVRGEVRWEKLIWQNKPNESCRRN